jgi:hypothetical protein
VYNATLSDAEYGDSSKGKKMVTWTFEISDGANAGRTLKYFTVTQAKNGIARIKKMLVRIAPKTNLKSFKPASTPMELIGTPCRLKVTQQMYQGEKRGNIKDVLPPAGSKVFDE